VSLPSPCDSRDLANRTKKLKSEETTHPESRYPDMGNLHVIFEVGACFVWVEKEEDKSIGGRRFIFLIKRECQVRHAYHCKKECSNQVGLSLRQIEENVSESGQHPRSKSWEQHSQINLISKRVVLNTRRFCLFLFWFFFSTSAIIGSWYEILRIEILATLTI